MDGHLHRCSTKSPTISVPCAPLIGSKWTYMEMKPFALAFASWITYILVELLVLPCWRRHDTSKEETSTDQALFQEVCDKWIAAHATPLPDYSFARDMRPPMMVLNSKSAYYSFAKPYDPVHGRSVLVRHPGNRNHDAAVGTSSPPYSPGPSPSHAHGTNSSLCNKLGPCMRSSASSTTSLL